MDSDTARPDAPVPNPSAFGEPHLPIFAQDVILFLGSLGC